MTVRHTAMAWVTLALVLAAITVGWASGGDETTVTAQVSSADHELQEGYFTLGDGLTVIARPGSDVHRFLARQRGRSIKITLSEARVLSKLND